MRGKSKLINVGLLVVALVLAAVIGEIGLRVLYGEKFGKRPGFFIGDSVLGWKPAPNLNHTFYGVDFTTHVRTDGEGYRLGALGDVDLGKRLIVLCGDSYTFGWGVSTGETMASYLDELVTQATDGRMRVLNLAVAGYGTLQSHLRLAQFLANHPHADVAAIMVFHSPNDPVDNIQSVGYHIGVWEVVDRQLKARSRFHIVNFLAFAAAAVKYRFAPSPGVEAGSVHPFYRDVAFAFDYVLPRSLPPSIDMNGHTVSLAGLSEADYSKEETVDRGNLTRIQRDLLREGIRSIQLLAAPRYTLFHGIVPSAPDWFVGEIMTLLAELVPEGDSTIVLGRYPDVDEFGRPYLNEHRGKHYNPAFNRYWAEKLMERLRAAGVLGTGD